MRKIVLIFLFFLSVALQAQKNPPKLKLEEPNESSCRKIEEKLYLNSLLNRSHHNQDYLDSVRYCMGETPDLFLVSGRYYYNNEEYASAITEFKKVVKSPTSDSKQTGEAFYYLGLASYYTGQYDSSYTYSKRALKSGFKTSWTYNNLGLAIAETGKWEEAVAYFKNALDADPSNDVAACNIGWSYDQIHNNKEALRYNSYADSIAHGNKALYKSNIIRDLIQLQREEEAFALAKEAYKKFPNHKDIIEDYSKVLFKEKKYADMLPLARKLLRMHPSNADDWFSIGYIYTTAGQEDSAFYFFKLSLKYDPKKAVAYDNISAIYKELGMFEKAHAYNDIALSLDSNYHYFYTRKSEIYCWQHDFENAYLWILKCK